MNKVTLYTIPNCSFCNHLKTILTEKKIPFEEKDVSKPEHAIDFAKVVKTANSSDVPMARVGKQLFIPNISFSSIEEAAELIEKFLI